SCRAIASCASVREARIAERDSMPAVDPSFGSSLATGTTSVGPGWAGSIASSTWAPATSPRRARSSECWGSIRLTFSLPAPCHGGQTSRNVWAPARSASVEDMVVLLLVIVAPCTDFARGRGADTAQRSRFPAYPCSEVVGEVVEAGDDVDARRIDEPLVLQPLAHRDDLVGDHLVVEVRAQL